MSVLGEQRYLWIRPLTPHMSFSSTGETLDVVARPSTRRNIRHTSDFGASFWEKMLKHIECACLEISLQSLIIEMLPCVLSGCIVATFNILLHHLKTIIHLNIHTIKELKHRGLRIINWYVSVL
jgi:hypothetical protein